MSQIVAAARLAAAEAAGSAQKVSESTCKAMRRAQAHITGAIPLPFSPWRVEAGDNLSFLVRVCACPFDVD
jgi:hypothetical protein